MEIFYCYSSIYCVEVYIPPYVYCVVIACDTKLLATTDKANSIN